VTPAVDAFRVAVRYLGMPGLLVGAVVVTFELLERGWHEGLVLALMGTAMFFVVWGLERLVPFRADWNRNDGQKLNDVGHTVFGTFLGGKLGNVLTMVVAGSSAAWIAEHTSTVVWPTEWPIALQVVLVFLVADLGRYVSHRAMHEIPFLWRFHELHHSADVLTVFKTSRNHLVERVFQQVFLFGPVIALGAPEEAILPFVVANSYLGVFDHSNVDFRLGPLEYVLMGPVAHRLHHSRDLREGNTNFGTALLVWDLVFGTYTNPVRRAREGAGTFDVGIEGDRTPGRFVDQVLDPLRRREGGAEPETSTVTG